MPVRRGRPCPRRTAAASRKRAIECACGSATALRRPLGPPDSLTVWEVRAGEEAMPGGGTCRGCGCACVTMKSECRKRSEVERRRVRPGQAGWGCMAKRTSAHGGCLGGKRRRRAHEPAKSCGEPANRLRSADARMGEPGLRSRSPQAESIGLRGEPGELKHLSTPRKRNQPRFPQ